MKELSLVDQHSVTAFVLEDAATVIERTHPALAKVWMKQVNRARDAVAKAEGRPLTSTRGTE
jgi:hypothetical protein